MKFCSFKKFFLIFAALSLASCGSKTQSLVDAARNDARSCLTRILSETDYSILKQHTNIEHPELINSEMFKDSALASVDEMIAFKKLKDQIEPCKLKMIASYSAFAPDLQIAFINVEIKSKRYSVELLNRKITWGKYNERLVENLGTFVKDATPALLRIRDNIALEERQAAIARQQAIQGLSILAGIALDLHAIAEANRPVYTTCQSNGAGGANCVSR